MRDYHQRTAGKKNGGQLTIHVVCEGIVVIAGLIEGRAAAVGGIGFSIAIPAGVVDVRLCVIVTAPPMAICGGERIVQMSVCRGRCRGIALLADAPRPGRHCGGGEKRRADFQVGCPDAPN
jgi:hypothetical protein